MNTSLPHSLEARYYTDPAIFVAEQTGLLSRTWQFAGHGSQLEKSGDYFTFDIAGENLFCIKGQDGTIRAFYNVCQHRAHQLVKGDGNCKVIVCPYHAWTYELSGSLRAGPNVKSVPGFDCSKICLNEIRSEQFHGFIFANLDPNAKPMDELYPGAREELLAFVPHFADLKPLEWIDVSEQCNWKVSVENYNECYHCQLNHRTFSNGVIKPDSYDIQPQGYCLRHTTECQNLEAMTYPIDLEANPHAGDYSSWFLWPMFSFQVYPGNMLNTYQWLATGVDRTVVRRGWYSINGQEDQTVRNLAVQDHKTTVSEDISLVESVQRGLGSRGYTPGPLVIDPQGGVNSEHSIILLQQWMRESIEY